MNGMALHGGLIPYGGTFLVFSDYCRPAIRLAALMKQRVIFVMTHDSIGLGEDGPTHQPVEHLAALRAIPNLTVFRPADAIETAECWQLALENRTGPSVLALTRQNLPALRTEFSEANLCARGAYEIARPRTATPTVASSPPARRWRWRSPPRRLIEKAGHTARVVSVPCFELFEAAERRLQEPRSSATRRSTSPSRRRCASAGTASSAATASSSACTVSAPAHPTKELYAKFGITADAAAEAASTKLKALL